MPGTLFGRQVAWEDIPDLNWEVPPGKYEAYISPDPKQTGWADLPNAGERFVIRYVVDDPNFPKVKGHSITAYYRPDDERSMSFLKNDVKKILGTAELPPNLEPDSLFGRRVTILVTQSTGKDGRTFSNVRVLGQAGAGGGGGVARPFASPAAGGVSFTSGTGARIGAGGVSGSALDA